MGFYMNNFGEGNTGKAKVLIEDHKAIVLGSEELEFIDPASGMIVLCVVSNPMFEAVGVAFSEREFEEFLNPDGRARTWLSIDRATAEKFAAGLKEELEDEKD